MKIYNKKGLFFGILLLALGLFNLIINIISPDDFLPEQIKDILFAALAIILGMSGFYRAFSKRATKEDLIAQSDERSRLITLKTQSMTLKILYLTLTVAAIASIVAYKLTANAAWIPIFTVSVLLLGFLFLVELIVTLYYEKKV